ncbi:NAD(+) synthase [Spartobacteria bacterium LR76]|nr:NAD(+) synthase [Spartobacteria bacterium LR76]
MKLIRVATAALNQTPLDWGGNERRIRQAITEARDASVSILCLPELCLTGYGCEDAFHAHGTREAALRMLERLLPETQGMVVSFGLPLLFQNALFNTICLVVNGRILGFCAKQFLAGDGIHYEPRWFKAWPGQVRQMVEVLGEEYPIGDLFFRCGDVNIGFEICEDAWVAARPGAKLALQGVDLILNPSASHFAFGKIQIRERFVLEGARAFNVTYLYSNLLGNESGRAIYDGGTLIASGDRLLAKGPRFSYQDVVLTSAVIDVDATRMSQARSASYRPQIGGAAEEPVATDFAWIEVEPAKTAPATRAGWENSPTLKEEEFTRAVALALFDYLRKSHSRGFVVSLSGGADSAAVSCLVSLMSQLVATELGLAAACEKIGVSPEGIADRDALTGRLLTCVYQASRNSSETTRYAAKEVARAIGAAYHEFDIGALVDGYTQMVEAGLGRKLSWQTDDIALQNIQARVRSPGIWMVANLQNALLLSTSNRSEAAVGYATMDGDTSGGLSPIAGIDKAFLRQWLAWLEKEGLEGIGPIPALRWINEQAPTAELRPLENRQTDEDDLMPYPVLDAIEKAAIRDKLFPLEVFRRLRPEFPDYTDAQFGLWIERFFKLWCHNQWKRERYAPSFHLDDENLDPKTWCRFPILSGGFERELDEFRKFLREKR